MNAKEALEVIKSERAILNAEIQFMSDSEREIYDLGRAAMIAHIMADLAEVVTSRDISLEDITRILGRYSAEAMRLAEKYEDAS